MRRVSKVVVAVVFAILVETAVMRLSGYPVGLNTVVRCRDGHLFTTIWIPGASVKSIRLGWWRVQYCPVGHHWTLVKPLKDTELDAESVRVGAEHLDIRLP